MTKRIKKSEWEDFIRGFSARNQFRLAVLSGSAVPKDLRETPLLYLLGVRHTTSAGEKMELYVTKAHDPHVGFLAASLSSPQTVTVTQDSKGQDAKFTVTSTGAEKMTMSLEGGLSDEMRMGVTAKIAYALFERNGRVHGRDFEHWGEAERVIRDLERMVNEGFV